MKTSEKLEIGQIYTRNQLRFLFNIEDATINTGVFRPKGHDSVWLFVTLHKTLDSLVLCIPKSISLSEMNFEN